MKYFLLITLLASSLASLACDCLMTPVEQHIRATPYLLTGTVVKILNQSTKEGISHRAFFRSMSMGQLDTVNRGEVATIRVLKDFKGRFKAGDFIKVDSHYSNCEPTFWLGKRYVLFMHQENKAFFVTTCSYSEELNGSESTNKLLETIRQSISRRE